MTPEPAQSPSGPKYPATTPDSNWLKLEIIVVLIVTFGLSGFSSALSLIDSALSPGGVGGRTVALNPSRSHSAPLDLLYQLVPVIRLSGWAALGLYLLWRSGNKLRSVGLGRIRARDWVHGCALAAVIGIPGLCLYLIAHAAGMSVTIVPAELQQQWWRIGTLILAALANSAAEEVIVVGYLLTRLRQLGWSANRALLASAVLRGSYHLYQGLGGGAGNLVMGLVFGRYWQRTGQLWPLLIAHAAIDVIAYLGYAALHNRISWLP